MKKLLLILCSLIIGFTGKTSEAQTGWSLQNNPLPDGTCLGKIQFVSPTEGWISADKGNLLHTTDAGVHWTVVTPFPDDTVGSFVDPATTMWWVDKDHGWKINWIGTGFDNTQGAVIHKTTDGGITWQKKVLSTTAGDAGLQVQFVDENNGWASVFNFSSESVSIMRSTDGGDNWSPIMGGDIFYFVDANNGWAITATGPPPYQIMNTTNGGEDWSVQYTDNTEGYFNAIQFTDLQNGWVVGEEGKIVKTNDGGSTWTPVTNTGITSESSSKSVFFLNDNTTGWIGENIQQQQGELAVILHTTDGGSSFTIQDLEISDTINCIFFWDANTGWFTAGVHDYSLIGHYTETTGVEENNTLPDVFSLSQNYPNPFNPTTEIKYSIKNAGMVSLKVYDILGQEVAILVNKAQTPGLYEVEFNAQNLTSGIYFYRLTVGAFSESKKLLLLK